METPTATSHRIVPGHKPGQEGARGGDEAAAPRPLLRRTLLMAVATRLLLGGVATLAVAVIGMQAAQWAWRVPRLAEPFHGALSAVFNPWARWDGVWFIKVAANGYASNDGSAAFFPLYPLVVRWVGVLFGNNLVLSGIAVSLVCYVVAMWLLYRLVAREFGDRIAWRTALYISIFPTAFFWGAVYSESMFLMLTVACFLWMRQGRWRLAGTAGLLAALTRSTGVLLLVPMIVTYMEQRDWKWRRTDSEVASLLMVTEGLMIWMAYLGLGFQKPLLFAQAQVQWQRSLAVPTFAVWRGIVAAFQGLRQIVSGQTRHLYWPVPNAGAAVPVATANLVNLTSLALAALAIWYGLRRLPAAYSAYAIVAVGYPLLFPATVMPLLSMPRFVLTVFPVFISAAIFTQGRRKTHVAFCVVSILCLIVLTAKFAVFSWVA